jgi:hypothetical protein
LTNDRAILNFVESVAVQIKRCVEQEAVGDTAYLGAALENVRSILSRFHLPDVDLDCDDAPKKLNIQIRAACGELGAALDRAIALGQEIPLDYMDPNLQSSFLKDSEISNFLDALDSTYQSIEARIDEISVERKAKSSFTRSEGIESYYVDYCTRTVANVVSTARLETSEVSRIEQIAYTDLTSIHRSAFILQDIKYELSNFLGAFNQQVSHVVERAGRAAIDSISHATEGFKKLLEWARSRVRLLKEKREESAEFPAITSSRVKMDVYSVEAIREFVLSRKTPPTEWCSRVTELDLRNEKLSGIEVIASFVNLKRLDLHGVELESLWPLAKLHNLETLYLEGASVKDLVPLRNISSLRNLYLDGSAIASVAALSELRNLDELWLSQTAIDDISPLSSLSQITSLYVNGTFLTCVKAIGGMPALRALDISATGVSDIAPLRSSSRLAYLELSGTKVADLSPLSHALQLETLHLSYTPVRDLSPLSELSSLSSVYVESERRKALLARTHPRGEIIVKVFAPSP